MNIALQFAIRKAGTQAALAKALGISSQAISQWSEIPANRVIQIEKVTGVHRSDLRPDLYPIEVPVQPPVSA